MKKILLAVLIISVFILSACNNALSLITYNVTFLDGNGYFIEAEDGCITHVVYGNSFEFKVVIDAGYDGSGMAVFADNKELTADANGVYTIESIKNDCMIIVTGVFPTSARSVKFYDFDGTLLGVEYVPSGSGLANTDIPMDSVKDASFLYWTLNGAEYTGGFSSITSDLILCAGYNMSYTFEVNFYDTDPVIALIDTINFCKDSALSPPIIPAPGFIGWFTDSDPTQGERIYSFHNIRADMDLYACYE